MPGRVRDERRRVCVFCGSSAGNRAEYRAAAVVFGQLLGEARLGLVYGGGHIGLMGLLADAALEAGTEVIGVIPRALEEREIAHRRLTALYVVETMHERKAKMAEESDAFVAMPGGYGTLDEFFEVLTWAQLGIHGKPCLLLNAGGYFDGLLSFLGTAVNDGFVTQDGRALIRVVREPQEVVPALQELWKAELWKGIVESGAVGDSARRKASDGEVPSP